jgi:hypothetical protein
MLAAVRYTLKIASYRRPAMRRFRFLFPKKTIQPHPAAPA